MKNINHFDYPSKQVITFKTPSFLDLQSKKNPSENHKNRYKENLQYHKQLERNKVKQNQKIKTQQESKKKKQQLELQLQKKLKQLENLEILQQKQQENQRKASELALLRQEQEKIKKEDELKKKLIFDENALTRFSEAMKKMYEEKQETNFKQRLAEQRRKTAQNFEKLERAKAEQYRTLQLEKEKNTESQIQSAEQYKKTIKTFTSNPHPDYNRTCVHNLRVIPQIKNEQENAFERGKIKDEQLRERSTEKIKRQIKDQRKSKDRAKQAFLKIQREKQYKEFQKNASQQQIKYNLERIQAGKKNQFIGIKPTTLSQMQASKKMRSQQEFDKMFYPKSTIDFDNFSKLSTKYEIVEQRMPKRDQEDQSQQKPVIKHKIKSYLKEKGQSQNPQVSQGRYSFEERQCSELKNSSIKSKISQKSQNQLNQNIQDQFNSQQESQLKNDLRQTRIPDEKIKKPPKDLPYLEEMHSKESISKQSKKKKPKIQEKQSFDTNEMLRKYGLKKQSPSKNEKIKPKQEGKRKVVELANICQNKPQKQQLSYSSESQEDSFT